MGCGAGSPQGPSPPRAAIMHPESTAGVSRQEVIADSRRPGKGAAPVVAAEKSNRILNRL